MSALYGISRMVARSRADAVAKVVQRLVMEKRFKLMGSSAGRNTTETTTSGNTQIEIKDGSSEGMDDAFVVSVTPSDATLCEELKRVSFLTIATTDEQRKNAILPAQVDDECPQNLKFYYFKNVEFDEQKTSSNGHNGGGGTPSNPNQPGSDPDPNPVSCEYPVKTCDANGNPTSCVDGYYKNGNTCIQCPDNTQTCGGSGFTCKAGYYKNGSNCTQCGNRQISSAGSTSCTTCGAGKTNNTAHTACENCASSDPNCGCSGSTPYADGNGGCRAECDPGYYKNGNTCVECPDNTQTCGGNGFTCKAGYYKNGSNCTQCGNRQISSAGSTSCTTCGAGKTNNTAHTACENCASGDPNCGCSGSTPYADGNGGCKFGCSSEMVESLGHCCPQATPYWDCSQNKCVANLSCYAQARCIFFNNGDVPLQDGGGNKVILSPGASTLHIYEDFILPNCRVEAMDGGINFYGNVFVDSMDVGDGSVYTYDSTPSNGKNKLFKVKGNFKGYLYSDVAVEIGGDFIGGDLWAYGVEETHISGNYSGHGHISRRRISDLSGTELPPIYVGGNVSTTGDVYDVVSGGSITGSLSGDLRAAGDISVYGTAGEVVSEHGKITVKDSVTDGKLITLDRNNGDIILGPGSNDINIEGGAMVFASRNLVGKSSISCFPGSSIFVGGNATFEKGGLVQGSVCGDLNIEENTSVGNEGLNVGGRIFGAGKVVRANYIKPSSPCTDDAYVSNGGEVSTQSGSYYFQDWLGYVGSGGFCYYETGTLRGPFSVSGNSCNKISWCVQNGHCQ